jgi:hypothetical protein
MHLISRTVTRRQFLRNTAVGGTGLFILNNPASAWSAQANEKLNIALVGVGGRGANFASTIPRMENLVALCDVDENKNPDAYARLPKAKKFRDFRRMLDDMGKGIDAVIVATPDHTHAVAAAAAMKAGKHVYCEKPLTRIIQESRTLRELARKQKVATSMGNQGTAAGPFRRALELIRDGKVGEIKEVHVWNDQGGRNRTDPPKGSEPVADGLDWDLWLGPAALRPFHREWRQWSQWRDFGTNPMGNWASHTANLAFMALKLHELWLNPPSDQSARLIRIEAKHSGVNQISFPRWEVIKWTIPARAEFPPIAFTWHNGPAPGSRNMIENILGEGLDWGDKKEKKWADFAGTVLVGDKGRLWSTGHNATFRLLPEADFQGVQRERPEKVEASRGHEQDWLQACRGGARAWANFDYADALNEFLMLGNVVTQVESGTVLEFDPMTMKIINHPAADVLLRCEYRQGWSL